MTVHSKINYDDQDDGRILKAAGKQQYIMFPAPISFLNDELKAELGMNTKKDDGEDYKKFCSLKVPIDPTDKDSKTYIVKIHKYDTGTHPRRVPQVVDETDGINQGEWLRRKI
jgi:hypothetical protein